MNNIYAFNTCIFILILKLCMWNIIVLLGWTSWIKASSSSNKRAFFNIFWFIFNRNRILLITILLFILFSFIWFNISIYFFFLIIRLFFLFNLLLFSFLSNPKLIHFRKLILRQIHMRKLILKSRNLISFYIILDAIFTLIHHIINLILIRIVFED